SGFFSATEISSSLKPISPPPLAPSLGLAALASLLPAPAYHGSRVSSTASSSLSSIASTITSSVTSTSGPTPPVSPIHEKEKGEQKLLDQRLSALDLLYPPPPNFLIPRTWPASTSPAADPVGSTTPAGP